MTQLAPILGSTAGGTEVTVTGTNFVTGTTVTVGGTPVPAGDVFLDSSTSLRFRTPPLGAGVAQVVIENAGAAASPASFTYVAAPTATALSRRAARSPGAPS